MGSWGRRGWACAGVLWAIGCGGSGSPDGGLEDRLAAASEGPVEVRLVHGLIRDVRGRFPTAGSTPEDRARGFVAQFADGFGLEDAATELTAGVELTDGAHTTVTFGRLIEGIPVDGSQLRAHFEGATLVLVTAQLPSEGRLDATQPTATEQEAIAALAADLGLGELPRAPAIALVAHAPGLATGQATPAVLAYRILATGPAGEQLAAYVDATTGQLLSREDRSATGQARLVGRYDPALAGGCSVQPCTAVDVMQVAHTVVYSESGPAGPTPTADEMAIYTALADVYDYWAATFGRDSFDDRGGELIVFVDHPAAPGDGIGGEQHQAVWKGDLGALFLRGTMVTPDFVAHELGHAVTGSIDSGVLYEPECSAEELAAAQAAGSDACQRDRAPLRNVQGGQSGALFEAVADVFAVFAMQRATGNPADWQLHDKLGVRRDLAATPQFGSSVDHFDRYDPAQSNHENGLIFGLAIYLMTEGGAHPRLQDREVAGIGRARVEAILYRALVLYFAPLTDFHDARWKMLRACEDLVEREEAGFSPRECGSVLNAFAAVGIGEWDTDYDTWVDSKDNCPMVYNPDDDDQEMACEDEPPAGAVPVVVCSWVERASIDQQTSCSWETAGSTGCDLAGGAPIHLEGALARPSLVLDRQPVYRQLEVIELGPVASVAAFGVQADTALPATVRYGDYDAAGAQPLPGYANPAPDLEDYGLYSIAFSGTDDPFAAAEVTVVLGEGYSTADCDLSLH